MQLLAAAESLGSFSLRARALGVADRTVGPHALAPGRRLVAEVALHEPCRPQLAEGEAARGSAQGSPCGTDKLSDAVEPVLVEVVDRTVAQELVRHEERGLRVHGSATCVGR